MDNYIITIARSFGSGGKEIASILSEKLGIPYYERQILTMASQSSGIDESEFVEVDEKLRGSYLVKTLTKLPTTNVLRPESRAFVSDINLFNIQAQIIRELAGTQSCIIVGKCADYILREKPNVISVFVEAYPQDCIDLIRSRIYVSEERARDLKKRTDKYRTAYYKYYTRGNNWRDPLNYDIFLNTSRVNKQKCAEIIAEAAKIKFDINV
ncbi:MAG: AAA family ATPase [Ruminococcus sp.]